MQVCKYAHICKYASIQVCKNASILLLFYYPLKNISIIQIYIMKGLNNFTESGVPCTYVLSCFCMSAFVFKMVILLEFKAKQ